MNKKKIFTFIFIGVLLLTLVVFVSYKNIRDNNSHQQTSTSPSSGNITTQSAASGTTVAPATTQNANTTIAQTQSPAATTLPAATTVESATEIKKPESKKEIIELYASAVNQVKSSAKSVANVYNNNENYEGIKNIGNNAVLEGLAKTLFGMFMVESNERTDYTSREDIIAHFPPLAVSTVSLTEAMFESATISDKGDSFEIFLKTSSTRENPELNPTQGSGAFGNAFSVLDLSVVTNSVKNFPVTLDGIALKYFEGTIKCVIDKTSGNIKTLEQYAPMIIHMDSVKMLAKIEGIDIGLAITDRWEVQF